MGKDPEKLACTDRVELHRNIDVNQMRLVDIRELEPRVGSFFLEVVFQEIYF